MHPMTGLPIRKFQKELRDHPSQEIAWKIIAEFYWMFKPKQVDNYLWFLASVAMTNEAEDLDAMKRNNVLTFYEFMRVVNDALAYLHKNH